MMHTIDINADLGEFETNQMDSQIMSFISSCNIACGGHAGNKATVSKTIDLAVKHQVAIGAHPAYPDKENFGRKPVQIPLETLKKSIEKQINLVYQHCEKEKLKLHHIKPHGALYHQAMQNKKIAHLICKVVQTFEPPIKLYGLPNSKLATEAQKAQIPYVPEGFADRCYENDGSLRPRTQLGAVLSPDDALTQVFALIYQGRPNQLSKITIHPRTICLHSDTENAFILAKTIFLHLKDAGIKIIAPK